jgi:hypothetical protein
MAKVPEFLSRFKLSYGLISLAITAIIMLQGAAITVMARRIDLIEDWGTGLFPSTVALIGLQLLVLGMLAFLCMVVNGELLTKVDAVRRFRGMLFKDRGWLFPIITLAPAVIGAIVAVEGLVVAYYASPMVVSGIGNVNGMWPAIFGAQLFLFGSALTVIRTFDGRLDLPATIRSSVLLLFASFGVLVYGLADGTTITGIGGIQEGTVELLGVQMIIIALLAVALMVLGDRYFLGRVLFGWKLGTLGVIGLSVVLCFEGMAVASIAAPFTIDSIGSMLEETMMLVGVGLAVLAMIVPASFYFMEKKDKNVRKLAYAATLFLFFMLPFAILM